MKEIITLKKLAGLLNLSIATVSRALKDHPDISAETKKRVKELSEMMDYEPNAYAISLKTNDSREFGIIVPEISNYFYHSVIAAIEEECRRYGYAMLILQSGNDPLTELENMKRCKKSRVSGLFVATVSEDHLKEYQKLESNNTPVIFFDKVPSAETCNKICVADAKAATLAAQTLIFNGHQNVLALFGNERMSITQERKKHFIEKYALDAPYCNLLVKEANSAEEAYRHTLKAWNGAESKPGAIFCMSDEILTGVMKAVQQLHLKIPTDADIIAVSNGFIPQLYYPEITYVETSGYKLGKLAFTRMMSCLSGSTFFQHITLETLLIKGGSVANI